MWRSSATLLSGNPFAPRWSQPIAVQRAEEGQHAPMAMRSQAAQALALRPPALQRCHVGFDTVSSIKTNCCEARLPGTPALLSPRDVGAGLLKSQQRFLKLKPSRRRNRHTASCDTFTPRTASSGHAPQITEQRPGRALHPDHAQGMGLCRRISDFRPSRRRAACLASSLQLAQAARQPKVANANQQTRPVLGQPVEAPQLAHRSRSVHQQLTQPNSSRGG